MEETKRVTTYVFSSSYCGYCLDIVDKLFGWVSWATYWYEILGLCLFSVSRGGECVRHIRREGNRIKGEVNKDTASSTLGSHWWRAAEVVITRFLFHLSIFSLTLYFCCRWVPGGLCSSRCAVQLATGQWFVWQACKKERGGRKRIRMLLLTFGTNVRLWIWLSYRFCCGRHWRD